MYYDRLNFKIQIDNEEQLIMSQANSDNSVIMDLEEYVFSVQPPRLRRRHVSEQVNRVSEMESYTLSQPSMTTQSSIGYTYTIDRYLQKR